MASSTQLSLEARTLRRARLADHLHQRPVHEPVAQTDWIVKLLDLRHADEVSNSGAIAGFGSRDETQRRLDAHTHHVYIGAYRASTSALEAVVGFDWLSPAHRIAEVYTTEPSAVRAILLAWRQVHRPGRVELASAVASPDPTFWHSVHFAAETAHPLPDPGSFASTWDVNGRCTLLDCPAASCVRRRRPAIQYVMTVM